MRSQLIISLAPTLVSAFKLGLITPRSSLPAAGADTAVSSCLTNSFYGSYGTNPAHDVYLLSEPCADQIVPITRNGGIVVLPEEELAEMRLVWLQDPGADASILPHDYDFHQSILQGQKALQALTVEGSKTAPVFRRLEDDHDEKQQLLRLPSVGPSILENALLYSSPRTKAVLISIPASLLPVIDTILPPFIVPIVLPTTPLQKVPIDPHAAKRLDEITSNLRFNPTIASILSTLKISDMRKDAAYLTGELGSGIVSRHSFSSGALIAADWIQGEIEKSGAKCEQKLFLDGFAPNVICRYHATINDTTATTILSAHYDSRGSFGSLRAPGGDDDGSGTTLVLAVARAIRQTGITFKNRLELVLFAGEEQGLLGSKAYAHELREVNANITLHIQNDMVAYRSPSEPLQLGLPQYVGLPEAAYLAANISKLYSPELTVGYSPACCSDHQSFHEQGFPATQMFERAGPIIDPMYHNSGDISNRTGYDFEQLRAIAKVAFATILETAGFDYD